MISKIVNFNFQLTYFNSSRTVYIYLWWRIFNPVKSTSARLTNQRIGKGKVFDQSREIVLAVDWQLKKISEVKQDQEEIYATWQRKVY